MSEERTVTLTSFEWGLVIGSLVYRRAHAEDERDREMFHELYQKIFRQLQMPENKEKGKQ